MSVELIKSWLSRLRLRRARATVARSGLFDAQYYRAQLGTRSREDPICHYLERGWRAGLQPNRLFDGRWYLEQYPKIAASGENPLVHFIENGSSGEWNPSPLFDAAAYLQDHPDVRNAGFNPLRHYLQFGRHESRSVRWLPGTPAAGVMLTPFQSWLAANALSTRDASELEERLVANTARLPRISIVVPVYRPDFGFLKAAVTSVTAQIFPDWEMVLVNDGGGEQIAANLDAMAAADPRIRCVHLDENGGISVATGAGVEAATGDVIMFLDQDDLLAPDCVAEVAIYYAEHPESDIVYSDDDKIDAEGRRYQPQFKPDWSPTLLLSWMYLGHVLTVRTDLFRRIGGFRPEFDGAQDHDFALRAAEVARAVGHIPRILYHWRAVPGSTALGGGQKPQSIERGQKAVTEALDRRGITGAVARQAGWAAASGAGAYELDFGGQSAAVSIVVETDYTAAGLARTLSALRHTDYPDYDIILWSKAGLESSDDLDRLARASDARIVRGGSADLIASTTADFLLFLTSGSAVQDPTWLTQLVGAVSLPNIGIAGPRLIGPQGRVAAAGQVHGIDDVLIGPAFEGLPASAAGYLGLAKAIRECSSVGRHCLITARELFMSLGGFADAEFGRDRATADYCYRAATAGRGCLACGTVDVHLPSLAPRIERFVEPAFRRTYGGLRDPWYNPNLSLETAQFEIGADRRPSRATDPVRLTAFSNNLNEEGAGRTLFDLLVGLSRAGHAVPTVVAPRDGPLRTLYREEGIELIVDELLSRPVHDGASHERQTDAARALIAKTGGEVVLANTLQTYWAVQAAAKACVPSLWAQHESDRWESYFDFLPPQIRRAAYDCFSQAYQVMYVARATRDAWRALETRGNFRLVRHGIPKARLDAEVGRWTRSKARARLGIDEEAHVLCLVGTLCARKGQLDAITAYRRLPEGLRRRTWLYLVGAIGESEYGERCRAEAAKIGSPRIVITGAVGDPFLYYRAADVALSTSRVESAPRVLVEAMACALPIIATPVFGVPEIVSAGTNALFYDPGDSDGLARCIEQLLLDTSLLRSMGAMSLTVLEGQAGFPEMVAAYAEAIREAASLCMKAFTDPASTLRAH